MRWPFPLVFLLGALAVPSSSAPVPIASTAHLELQLRAVNPRVKPGQSVQWEVSIINHGKRAVTLVQPGDGSDCGWRTPIIEWVIDGKVPGAAGALVEERKVKKGDKDARPARPERKPVCLTDRAVGVSRCGNINRLKASEVFSLEPGKAVKLNEWVDRPSLSAGTHKVAVRYFHIPSLRWKGLPLGKHDQEAMKRITNSQAVTLESNTVEVVVPE